MQECVCVCMRAGMYILCTSHRGHAEKNITARKPELLGPACTTLQSDLRNFKKSRREVLQMQCIETRERISGDGGTVMG